MSSSFSSSSSSCSNHRNNENGFTGFVNLGNTCFLNACLQCLNHTYELQNIFENPKIVAYMQSQTQSDNSILTAEWKDLCRMMWERNGAIRPNRFLRAVHVVATRKNKDLFTNYSQNDICEFLLFMIDAMHESICRNVEVKITGNVETVVDKMALASYDLLKKVYATEYSEVMELFYGMYVTVILDHAQNETLCIHPEQFFILDLQLFHANHRYANIYECFDAFTKPEFMHGDNQWLNENTGEKEEVYKVTTFWSLPDVLVLCLKRFSSDGNRKIQHLVDFPLSGLDLGKYVKGYRSQKYIYDLYGVCNHMGGIQGGHYTANIKHLNGHWYNFNDTICRPIENPTEIISPSAYCLFYRIRKEPKMQN